MKAFVSFVVLSLIVAGSAVGLCVRRESQAAALRLERQTAAIEELGQKLESLGERLATVERNAGETPDVVADLAPGARPAAAAAGEEAVLQLAAVEGSAGDEDRDASSQAFARQLVASLGTDGEREFRDYVRQVYMEERNARKDREAAEAEAQRKEYEELGQGPYGKYNRRVNTLGKQLAMDDRQKQRYHDLLASYSSRLQEMRKAVDWRDKSAREGFRATENALQSEFDAHVAHLLSQQQAEDYSAMGPGEKSLAGSEAGMVHFKIAEGGVVTEDVKGFPDVMMGEARVERAVKLFGGGEGALRGIEITTEGAPPEKQERTKVAPPAGGE